MEMLDELLAEAIRAGFEVVNVNGRDGGGLDTIAEVWYGYRAAPRRDEAEPREVLSASEFADVTASAMRRMVIEKSLQAAPQTDLIATPAGIVAENRQRQESVDGAFVFEAIPVAANYLVPARGGASLSFWFGFSTSAALSEWFDHQGEIVMDFGGRCLSGFGDEYEALHDKLLRDLAKHVSLSDFDLDEWAAASGIALQTRAQAEAEAAAFAEAHARKNPVIETPAGVPVTESSDVYAGCVVRVAGHQSLRIITAVTNERFLASTNGRILESVTIEPSSITHVVFPVAGYKPSLRGSRREQIGAIYHQALKVRYAWKDGDAIYRMEQTLYDDLKFGPESRRAGR